MSRAARARQLVIVGHHGVVPDDANELPWRPLRSQVTASVFRAQVEAISRHYQWVTEDEAIAHITGAAEFKNPILMTFDDGYRNNFDIALPILREHGIRPVVFIATQFMSNSQPFWFDRFDFAIQQIAAPWSTSLRGREFQFVPHERSQQGDAYAQLRSYAKAIDMPDEEFNGFFADACAELEASSGKSLAAIQRDDLWSSTTNAEVLRAKQAAGEITVGSHTVDHIRIAQIDATERKKQLDQSKTHLESIIGHSIRSFCYPNGSWSQAAVRDVAAAGYAIALTSDDGFNKVGCNPYTLRRAFLPTHADAHRLLGELSGATAIYSRVRSKFAS